MLFILDPNAQNSYLAVILNNSTDANGITLCAQCPARIMLSPKTFLHFFQRVGQWNQTG